MVSMACNTRFLKIVFNLAEIFDFYTFPRKLKQRWNRFRVCWVSDEICSVYDQSAMKFVPHMLNIFWMMILKWCVISMRENWLLIREHARKMVTLDWACMKIEILAKIERKDSTLFFEYWPRLYKVLIEAKQISKLAHACVPLSKAKCEQDFVF